MREVLRPLRVVEPTALSMRHTQAFQLVDPEGKRIAFVLGDDEAARAQACAMAYAVPVLDALRELVLLVNARGGALGMTSPEFWRVIWAGRDALSECSIEARDE